MNPIKIILVGESTVGKTSIITQYIENRFEEEHLITTNCDKFQKDFQTKNGETIKIEIWDTAGNERFRAVNKIFMKNSKIAIIVYDITNEDSFKNLNYWYEQVIKDNNKDEMVFAIAGNKSDLYEEQKVTSDEGQNFAKSINAIFGEISAMDHESVENFFVQIVNTYYDKIKKEEEKKKIIGKTEEKEQESATKDNNEFKLKPVKSSSKKEKNSCDC